MQRARDIIREVLAEAQYPAILWSAGKDSQLLLHLVREIDETVPCIWFHQGMTREQEQFAKQMILEMDLHVWSWLPSDVYVVPNDNGLSLVAEQSFGQQRFPVIRDIEEGSMCVGDYPGERTLQLFPHFDSLFIGYKDSDTHFSLGGSNFCPEDGWALGRSKVYAPLRSYTDEEVWNAIRELDVAYDKNRYEGNAPDPSTLQACTRCLQAGGSSVFCPKEQKEIPSVNWNPSESLRAFQQRFHFRQAA